MQLPQTGEAWARRGLMLLGLMLLVGLGISTVYRSGPHAFGQHTWGSQVHRTDFTVYHAAGRAVLDGTNIYDAANPRGWYFMYLPVVAVVFVPLALLNYFWSSLIWYALSVAMLAHAAHMSVQLARRYFPRCRVPKFWLYVLAGVGVAWPAISGLARGQASLLISYLVIASIWLFTQRRVWLAGLCLAGGIVLKIFPVLLLVYFAAKRQWRQTAVTLVWLLALLVLVPSAVFGVRGNIELVRQWMTTIALPANNPEQAANNKRYAQLIDPRVARNQSVQAVAIRWLAGWNETVANPAREPFAHRVALGINLGLALISIWACRRGGGRPDDWRTLQELCVVILLMLFLSPVTWVHNCTLLILPLAVMAACGAAERSVRIGLACFAVGTVLALAVPRLHAGGAFLLGAAALWAVLVWSLHRNGQVFGGR